MNTLNHLPQSNAFQVNNQPVTRGGYLAKQAILDLIITTARYQVKQGVYPEFKNLLEPCNQWKHKHYCNLACMLDMAVNTLKYYTQKGDELKKWQS